jgi:hypothetical protein
LQKEEDHMPEEKGTPIFKVWDKYETIAMHFNDLLIKLRMQAIGGVAAIATIVAVIGNTSSENSFNWAIMAGVFFFLCVFWTAIWVLDFKYYNRLLLGAVDALFEIEKLSKTTTHIEELKLSHKIEGAVIGSNKKIDKILHKKLSFGRQWFYRIVFFGLLIGLLFSLYMLIFQ